MKPLRERRPRLNPVKSMSYLTLASAQIKARLSARQPVVPSSSMTRTWPGTSPANDTSPDPPDGLNHWKARLWPARARFPTSVAVATTDFRNPPLLFFASWFAAFASPPGTERRVSIETLVVFQRNFVASANIDWSASSWQVMFCANSPLTLHVMAMSHLVTAG